MVFSSWLILAIVKFNHAKLARMLWMSMQLTTHFLLPFGEHVPTLITEAATSNSSLSASREYSGKAKLISSAILFLNFLKDWSIFSVHTWVSLSFCQGRSSGNNFWTVLEFLLKISSNILPYYHRSKKIQHFLHVWGMFFK